MKDIAEKSLFVIPENIKRLLWLFIISSGRVDRRNG